MNFTNENIQDLAEKLGKVNLIDGRAENKMEDLEGLQYVGIMSRKGRKYEH